jgi:hypothetical protein
VTWASNVATVSEVDYGTSTQYSGTVTDPAFLTAHSLAIPGLSPGTIYHFRVAGTDSWGNPAVSGDYTMTTAPGNLLPVISSFLVSSSAVSYGQSAVLSWTTSSANSLSINQGVGSVTGKTSVTVTPAVTTTYTLTATNGVGSTTSSVTLVVNSGADQHPTGSFAPVSASGVISGWTLDPDNANLPIAANIYIDLNAGTVGAVPIRVVASGWVSGQGNHGFSYSLPNVYRDNQPHQVWVWGVDLTDPTGASNTQLVGSPQSFTFSTPDASAPVINGLTVTSVLPFTASFGWLTNEPATTQVQYGTTSAYGSLSPLNISLVTTHVGIITGLRPHVTYHYSVISADANGNTSTSPDATITTP